MRVAALKHPLLLGALAVAGVAAVALSPDMAADMTPRADNDPAEVRRLLEHVAIVGQMFRACGKARPAEATRFSIAVNQWWDRNERARLILDDAANTFAQGHFVHQLTSIRCSTQGSSASTIAPCPSSTPTLNAASACPSAARGRPKSASTLAKPKPCTSPKPNASARR